SITLFAKSDGLNRPQYLTIRTPGQWSLRESKNEWFIASRYHTSELHLPLSVSVLIRKTARGEISSVLPSPLSALVFLVA
ncbi:hypothetical protein J6590_040951, partial [Homalodisca vitripennis]